jgi:hypothetical protein
MTMFDDRAKAFESKFAHDEFIAFKSKARRNRLFAGWVSGLMQQSSEASADYISTISKMGVAKNGDTAILDKVKADLALSGVPIPAKDIEHKFEQLLVEATYDLRRSDKP